MARWTPAFSAESREGRTGLLGVNNRERLKQPPGRGGHYPSRLDGAPGRVGLELGELLGGASGPEFREHIEHFDVAVLGG